MSLPTPFLPKPKGMLANVINQCGRKIILINMVVKLYFPFCVSAVAAGHLISFYLEGNQTIIERLMSKRN